MHKLINLASQNLTRDLGPDCELPTLLFDTCSHILYALPDLQPSLRPPTLQALLAPSGTSPRLAIELLPDLTFARLTRLFGQYAPAWLVANPWELLDHTDPSSATSSAVVRRSSQHAPPQLVNIGPLDLAAFRARVVETIPAVTALDAVSVTSTASSAPPGGQSQAPERGAQTSFDFETPCTALPVAARDHRRTLAVTRLLAQRMEQNTAAAAAAAAQAQAQAQARAQAQSANGAGAGRKRAAVGADATKQPQGAAPAPPASAAANANAATGTAAPAGRGPKRKASSSSASAEVVVLDSDEEQQQAPSAAKAAKKTKTGTASGAAAASAARKTTGGKTASKTTKKRK